MKSARNSWADHVPDRLQKEVYPGAEIPFVPVEPDVLDVGDVVEGVGGKVVGLVTPLQVIRGRTLPWRLFDVRLVSVSFTI